MSRDLRIVLRFAALGLGFAAMFFIFARFDTSSAVQGPSPVWIRSAIVTLCPGCLLFATLDVDIKPHTQAFSEMWLIITLANTAIYATIGTSFAALRRMRNSRASDQVMRQEKIKN
ncbi:MAG TPA: hypothetical protein VKD70_06820 [Candidatus Acidoferrum sp.]|nr:hypothetical protein [Candidatus Acidoferrum sp.]